MSQRKIRLCDFSLNAHQFHHLAGGRGFRDLLEQVRVKAEDQVLMLIKPPLERDSECVSRRQPFVIYTTECKCKSASPECFLSSFLVVFHQNTKLNSSYCAYIFLTALVLFLLPVTSLQHPLYRSFKLNRPGMSVLIHFL